MIITWHGHSCFTIKSTQKGKDPLFVLINPFSQDSNLKLPKTEADILLADYKQKVKIKPVKTFLISAFGEYETKGVFVQAIPSFEKEETKNSKKIIYTIELEQVRIAHLGEFNQKELYPDQIEKMGRVDILILPVGNDKCVDAQTASKIISQVEPSIVIPANYKTGEIKDGNLDTVDKFLKVMGQKEIESVDKLKVSSRDINKEDATQIIVLEAK